MNLSVEVMPSEAENFIKTFKSVCANNQDNTHLSRSSLRVFLAHVNGKPYQEVIQAGETLTAEGFKVVPHLAVRNLRESDALEKVDSFLSTTVDEVLLLGGDNESPALFNSVYDFINSSWATVSAMPVDKINFSIFPEGHPHVGLKQGELYLQEKIGWALKKNMAVGLYSQICLEARPIIEQIKRLESIDVDINIGVVAPCKFSKMLKIAAISGIKNSVSFLKKSNIFKLIDNYDSDEIIQEIKMKGIQLGGLHCYAFGNYEGAFKKLQQYSDLISQP